MITLRDLRVMPRATVRKKIPKLKTKIVLEMINDLFTEYPNIYDFLQQELIEKCDRERISIDEIF